MVEAETSGLPQPVPVTSWKRQVHEVEWDFLVSIQYLHFVDNRLDASPNDAMCARWGEWQGVCLVGVER